MPDPERFTGAALPAADARRELRTLIRRSALLGAVVAGLLLAAAVALSLSEGVGLWYAFRWSLDTAATVGGFPQPRGAFGQIVDVALILVGVATLFWALATVTELFVTGHLGEVLAARRSQRMIEALNHHHIICGFGRVGRQVARDLHAAGAPYVVVDSNVENRPLAESHDMQFIEGDATDDAVLLQAGLQRSRALIACADSDAQNVFITLTARGLRADIVIVARAATEDTERKLKRAGADRVISPYKASGTEMARLALHPQLSGVVDVDVEYRMEEIVVGPSCSGVGKRVDDVRGDTMIVGLRRGEDFQPQPPADTTLLAGDQLVAMGTSAALERLEGLLEAA
ncbi:MAG TPA: TrkA family potassium uptake protein [Solirubrobacteraceae bacterium]|nr:TrkA family potassium uptake protein [Solirubrobacteraceae bacterium]